MTAIIGLRCSDGIVIGSDSSATFAVPGQPPTIEQPIKKVFVIEDRIVLAGTGQVGAGQRFAQALRRGIKEGKLTAGYPTEFGKQLSHLGQEDFAQTNLQRGQYGALVAFRIGSDNHLCEFPAHDFQPELKEDLWFASMGSGQQITDPFLAFLRSVFFPNNAQPNLKEGIFLTAWALEHVIKHNPGGINGPPQIAVLQGMKARELSDDELAEHRNSVTGAELHLRQYADILNGRPIERPAPQELPAPPVAS